MRPELLCANKEFAVTRWHTARILQIYNFKDCAQHKYARPHVCIYNVGEKIAGFQISLLTVYVVVVMFRAPVQTSRWRSTRLVLQ